MLGQRYRLQSNPLFNVPFSAPGQTPPPQLRNTHGTSSDLHQDIVNTQNMVRNIQNMLKSQELVTSHQIQSVSVTRIMSLTEYILTVT